MKRTLCDDWGSDDIGRINEKKTLIPKDSEFGYHGHNPLHSIGTLQVALTKGWSRFATTEVKRGNRSSIIGQDLMSSLGLQLIQKLSRENLLSIQSVTELSMTQKGDAALHLWQEYFYKHFSNLLRYGEKMK